MPRWSRSACRAAFAHATRGSTCRPLTEEYLTYGHRIKQYIADTSRLVLERLDDNELVVFEGAQGTLLDIDHGTYPFVIFQPDRWIGDDRSWRRPA